MMIKLFVDTPDYPNLINQCIHEWVVRRHNIERWRPYLARQIYNQKVLEKARREFIEFYEKANAFRIEHHEAPIDLPITSHSTLYAPTGDTHLKLLYRQLLTRMDEYDRGEGSEQNVDELISCVQAELSNELNSDLTSRMERYMRQNPDRTLLTLLKQTETLAQAVFASHQNNAYADKNQFHYTLFLTQWGSTALGFGGVGGASITDAITVVIQYKEQACVFFDERFAYYLREPNAQFALDLAKRRIASVSEHQERYAESNIK